MYNTDIPNREELPSTAKLIRSTIIAAIVAVVLLVTVVMPAEYSLDPTGVGRLLGLTEMGEIKEQLAEEAAADEAAQLVAVQPSAGQQESEVAEPVVTEPVREEAPASEPEVTTAEEPPAPEPTSAEPQWEDEVRVVLTPGEGTEYKLTMEEGAVARFPNPKVAQSITTPMAMAAASRSLTKKDAAFPRMRANWSPHSRATMAGSSATAMTVTSPWCFVLVGITAS